MSTYTYDTGKIERDFVFRSHGEKCRLGGLPAKVGNTFCQHCRYYCGSVVDWHADLENTFFTKCKHPDAKDSENSDSVEYLWRERFIQKALAAFYD